MLQSTFIIIREDSDFFSAPGGFLKKKHILETAKKEGKKENIYVSEDSNFISSLWVFMSILQRSYVLSETVQD